MKQNEASQPVTYTPAVTAAGTAIALYLLSKIGELVVILLLWGAYAALAYAALHVTAAWLGVPIMVVTRECINRVRQWGRQQAIKRHAEIVLPVARRKS